MLKLYSSLINSSNLLKTLKIFTPISQFHTHRTRTTRPSNPAIQFILDETQDLDSPIPTHQPSENCEKSKLDGSFCNKAQISHPWPEWVDLMAKLLRDGYFDQIGNPFGNGDLGPKESNIIRTACLNLARDRSDLIRYLCRKDIQVIAGSGCPSLDRKVVNSGKRLRAHVSVDEGNVCSACVLRGNCERAYVKAREDEGGRTVDVMRFLLTYGLDPITSSVENKPCLNKKVKESVRKLLKEVVDHSIEEFANEPQKATALQWNRSTQQDGTSHGQGRINVQMKQGDWICPECSFMNFARNIRCLSCDGLSEEKLSKLREEQDHMPLKKGDWICHTCNFLNFAKNTRCLQCKEKPPKRPLNPGEWECESCNYINFRRNMVCLKCDHRRPKALNSSSMPSEPASHNTNRRCIRPSFGDDGGSGDERSDSWNFVEGDSEDHDGSSDHVPGFVDFPVVGGKSELSRNSRNRERWKVEMLEERRSAHRAREYADELKSSMLEGDGKSLLCNEDDEMAEWFGSGKNQKIVKHVSEN